MDVFLKGVQRFVWITLAVGAGLGEGLICEQPGTEMDEFGNRLSQSIAVLKQLCGCYGEKHWLFQILRSAVQRKWSRKKTFPGIFRVTKQTPFEVSRIM